MTGITGPSGVRIAVVETPGGDLEHLAVALPSAGVALPQVAGFPIEVVASPSFRLALVSVPALQAVAVAAAMGSALEPGGALAVVALGPAPARELVPVLEGWPAAPPLPAPRCPVADGTVQVVRGSAESTELAFAAPGPADPQFDLLPALAGWLQRGLVGSFPGVRVDVGLTEGCASLLIRAPAGEEGPRSQLERLRGAVRARAAAVPDPHELAAVARQLARGRLRWAVDGRFTARELVTRLVAGGSVSGALADPLLDAETLAALARRVLGGRAGAARLVERERRAVRGSVETLDNGVTVAVTPLGGDAAVVALALAGLDPARASGLLAQFAQRAADRGWYARVSEVVGVPAAGVAAPADEVEEVLEMLADVLSSGAPAPSGESLAATLLGELGLSPSVHGAAVSVAIGTPADPDEASEAAAKFLAALPAPPITVHEWPVGPALRWSTSEGSSRLVAAVELAPTAATLVAGEVVRRNLAQRSGLSTRWLAVAGRVVLLVEGEGDRPLPALDAAMAEAWLEAQRQGDEGGVLGAAHGLLEQLSGDLLQATLRRAVERFLPVAGRPETLLAVELGEVRAALAALPPWQELRRVGRGPAPPPPPPRGVRESRLRP